MNNNQTPNFGQEGSSNVRPIRPQVKVPKGLIIIGVIIALLLFVAAACTFTVAEDELAVVKMFGETKQIIVNRDNNTAAEINKLDDRFKNVKVVQDQGLFFKIPFITKVEKHTSKLLTYQAKEEDVTTKNRKKLRVQIYAQWRIVHPGLYATNYGNELNASSKIDESLYAEIFGLINNLESEVFLNNKEVLYNELEKIRTTYNDRIKNTGIEIQDLEIFRIALPKSNYDSVYTKMMEERNTKTQEFISEGLQIYVQKKSEVDLNVSKTLSAATETSAIIRGEADAEVVNIYADAFGQSPKFYEFWRTLQAYENMINENTTIYIDKNNPFLKYFSQGLAEFDNSEVPVFLDDIEILTEEETTEEETTEETTSEDETTDEENSTDE